MKKILKINSQLFEGLKKEEIISVLNCLNARRKKVSKQSYIWTAGDKAEYIGVVIQGQVNIIKEDALGNRIIISNLSKSKIFGESFSIAKTKLYPVTVQAATDCTVILLKTKILTSTCPNRCEFHKKIIDNLLNLIAQKNINLNNRINCISKKSIKQKLLFYLLSKTNPNNKYEVTIPFNRKELSDYLSVNRSALSRVLSKLKKDKIISYNKNKFKLLDIERLKKIMEYR